MAANAFLLTFLLSVLLTQLSGLVQAEVWMFFQI
jgi:hypothetical protein